ncbi:MAG: hypothetical protein QE278_11720 [Limnobacter sp.]|nr:hypothetical protein [Limnobacter sp.]
MTIFNPLIGIKTFPIAVMALTFSLLGCSKSDEPLSTAQVTDLASAQVQTQTDEGSEKLEITPRVIPQTDLPPEGTRSLFDHFAAQNHGVPYPFSKLVETLGKLNPEGKAPVVVMLPHGRSLLKGQANDEKPRVLLAADFQAPNTEAALGVNMRGQMFLGFTENADEIEVLSYNEAAGRFEFQLVQDYTETGSRKLVYAKRQICLTCHQGGAPIFSQRPWNETNASTQTIQNILTARKGAGLDPHSYLGLPTSVPLSEPERYDELTDVASFFATTQKLWLDGCGKGDEGMACRKTLFKLALEYKAQPGDFKEEGPIVSTLKELQKASLGNKPILVAESDLVNRDPYAEIGGWKGFVRKFTSANIKLGDGAKNNEDLEAFDKLPKLPVALDPLTKRQPKRTLTADHIDGVYGVASLLTESDIQSLMKRADFQIGTLTRAVDQLPNELFGERQFERVKLVQALMESKNLPGPSKNLQYAFTDVSEMSPPVASGEPPLELSANSPLLAYKEYCFSCHRGNPSKRLNFLGADTEDKVLAELKDKIEVRDALDWDRYKGTDKASILMPPTDSAQYAKLVDHLKKDPDALKTMRATVPGLFGL